MAVLAIGWLLRIGTYYLITDHRIVIRRGILSRRESSASIDRVQNVNTSQSFIERMLNTGSVDFDTAGSDAADADFTFVGIDDPHGLRDSLDTVTRRALTGAARPALTPAPRAPRPRPSRACRA